jgi:hypothetical protein
MKLNIYIYKFLNMPNVLELSTINKYQLLQEYGDFLANRYLLFQLHLCS